MASSGSMLPSSTDRRGVLLFASIAIGGAAGTAIANADKLNGVVSFGIALTLVVAFGIFALSRSFQRCRASLRSGYGWTGLASGLIGAMMLVAVALSGFQLATGLRQSTLAKLGLPVVDAQADVTAAFLLFLLAGIALVAGESLATATRPRRLQPPAGKHSWTDTRWTYFALIALSVVGFALAGGQTQQETFSSRGTVSGQGIQSLLGYAYVLAVAIGILQRHWGSRQLAALSTTLVVAGLFLGGTRTPLAVVGTAVVLRLIVQTQSAKHTLRFAIGGLALTYVALVLLVGVAEWRGTVADQGKASLIATLFNVAPDPLSRLAGGGLDTLDGLILARQVDREAVGAHVTDPAKALTTFVPRRLWPGKPEFLGRPISAYYTAFGGNSGLFLSGAGYGYIVFFGAAGMALMFFTLGYLFEVGYELMRVGSIWTVLLSYFAVRFFVAGDAFDAHHVLGLCLLIGIASGLARISAGFLPREWSQGSALRNGG